MKSHFLKPFAVVLLSMAAATAYGQFRIVRPEKPSAPAVKPESLSQAPAKVKENAEQNRSRAKTRRKVQRQGEARRLPPVEFNQAAASSVDLTSKLDTDLYKGNRPASHVPTITNAAMRPVKVGALTLNVPDCLTVFEQGDDFFIAGMADALEIDVRMLDAGYKLSTPQAYIKHIETLYGGVEKNETEGNRTLLTGFDTRSNRNYHIIMQTDNDKFYVTRVFYSPAVARPVRDRVIPALTD